LNQTRALPLLRKHLYAIVALAALFVIAVTLWIYHSNQPKNVQFFRDGKLLNAQTKTDNVGQFLKEQSIQLSSYDQLAPSTGTNIANGMRITYVHRWPVAIRSGKESKTVITSKHTVGELLHEQQISLGEQDRVYPAKTATLAPNQTVMITRVEEKTLEEAQVIPYREVERRDLLLPQGTKKVIQEGQDGKAIFQYKIVYENGKEVSRKLLDTKIIQDKQDKVISIGALATVSRGGTEFSARRVLEDVKLTAYGPGSSCTASGTSPVAGRTIAVDPDVIPMGQWVYIEGVGFRRAEDTGGAINGKKIDIYMDSNGEAGDFGVQRASKVYVIGPRKPE
jgi:3D (Asp-Asp-Asp) domain-containing protein